MNDYFCNNCEFLAHSAVMKNIRLKGLDSGEWFLGAVVYCIECIESGRVVFTGDEVRFEHDVPISDPSLPFLRLFRWADDENRSSKSRIYEESFEQMIKRTN